jgi:hypothetical protein
MSTVSPSIIKYHVFNRYQSFEAPIIVFIWRNIMHFNSLAGMGDDISVAVKILP